MIRIKHRKISPRSFFTFVRGGKDSPTSIERRNEKTDSSVKNSKNFQHRLQSCLRWYNCKNFKKRSGLLFERNFNQKFQNFHCLQFSNNTIFEVQFEKFQKKELEVISLLKGGTRGIDATIKNPKNFSHRFQFFKIVQFEKFQNFPFSSN